MATLRPRPALENKGPRAISTLPEVKCTSCGASVPLDDLPDHECAPSPVKSATPKPPAPTPTPPPAAPKSPLLAAVQALNTPVISAPPPSRSTTPSLSPSFRQQSRPDAPPLRRALTDEGPRSSVQIPPLTPKGPPPPARSMTPVGRAPTHMVSPSGDLRPMNDSPRVRTASTPTPTQNNFAQSGRVPDTPARSPTTPVSPFTPMSPFPPHDSKSGGEAGMAGVGRRAFHAAAQVAFLTTSLHPHSNGPMSATEMSTPGSPFSAHSHPRTPSPGPQPSFRSNSPQSIRHGGPSSQGASVPPSPIEQRSRVPPQRKDSGSDSDESEIGLAYNRDPEPDSSPVTPPAVAPSFSKDSIAFPTEPQSPSRSLSSKSSASSFRSPSRSSRQRSGSETSEDRPETTLTRKDSLGSASVYSSGTVTTTAPITRKLSKSTGALGRPGAFGHLETLAEEEVDVDIPALPSSALLRSSPSNDKSPSRSNTAPSRTGGEPLSSQPSPTSASATTPTTRRKRATKTCVRCNKIIDNGRWIAVELEKEDADGGGVVEAVMCEKDWKEMYLPKCRKCGKTIESHAVSSADGQLKGKYHRECFNCTACEKPFPDRSFYVFGGRPYCEYHYHLSNRSLCCNRTCGKPIEGPCAEDHEGNRYHPEHLVCDEKGCGERLVDYFEVGGKKYCERHAPRDFVGGSVGSAGEGGAHRSREEEEEVRVKKQERNDQARDSGISATGASPTSKAVKRRTRFLEL